MLIAFFIWPGLEQPFFFGFFLGLACGQFPGLHQWLLTWQTLVAGWFAVVAAGLTIAAMLTVDIRQQHRHIELLKTNLAPSRLRAHRAAAAAHQANDNVQRNLPATVKALRQFSSGPMKIDGRLKIHLALAKALVPSLTANPDILAARDLFPPDVVRASQNTELWGRQFAEHPILADEIVPELLALKADDLANFLETFCRCSNALVEHLDALAASYA